MNHTEADILRRLDRLETQNRRLKLLGGSCVLLLLSTITGLFGFQAPAAAPGAGGGVGGPPKISADEITVRQLYAESILIRTEHKGTLTLDHKGITLIAPGLPTNEKINLVNHEARIHIGMDYAWLQDTFLRPTPRIAVGRTGHDTANNLKTRYTLTSPEGVHSSDWHTNNDQHDGRTDRELIDELKRRR